MKLVEFEWVLFCIQSIKSSATLPCQVRRRVLEDVEAFHTQVPCHHKSVPIIGHPAIKAYNSSPQDEWLSSCCRATWEETGLQPGFPKLSWVISQSAAFRSNLGGVHRQGGTRRMPSTSGKISGRLGNPACFVTRAGCRISVPEMFESHVHWFRIFRCLS